MQCAKGIVLAAMLCGIAMVATAQDDSPSLGDVARQSRQQKQLKDASSKTYSSPAPDTQGKAGQNQAGPTTPGQNKDAPAPPLRVNKTANKIITDDEMPSHAGSTTAYQTASPASHTPAPASNNADNGGGKPAAEAVTSQIRAMKDNIDRMQSEIDRVSASIQYAGGNCVSGCVQWNEAQKRKQDEVDTMKAQLEQARQQLEQMQDTARQQGYGSSVYDP